MKCFRILPEMWARTLWPFSNSTRNIALGNGLDNGTAFDLDGFFFGQNQSSFVLTVGGGRRGHPTQDLRGPRLGDGYRVLEVGGSTIRPSSEPSSRRHRCLTPGPFRR